MFRLIVHRVILGVLTLLAVSALIFVATEILPGDVASAVLGQGATPETLAVFRHELGLDRPAYIRYFEWLFNALQGDLGVALTNKRDIVATITPKFDNTMFLAGYAALIAVPLAVGMGIVAAINEGKWIDRAANIVSLAAISFPEFFIAYVLILFFAVRWHLFPVLSTVFPDMTLGHKLYVVALPAVTLTMLVTAHMLRMTRSSVLSIMSQPYIEMAFLKGLKRSRVVFVHALPNAAAPIITVIALNLAYLIVGVVVIETVFVYPGVGQFMVDGVTKRDLPVVQACGLVFAGAFVILNTIADVLAILVNPRLRKAR
ncbi:MAG TPA: ABC transporter permease [Hypericibacter adhaerens]|jgi:peptide/nickel transport system permease protein|uniref:ABC transporter permease n=1 Tax=Hypericibacter adhaerens TaxID=2602016 RepID=A0A5J6N1S6_9PROT|nr:ABC transporter permease [Hypericibacter adhaerens]QEX23908.1 ABC transporter permease [Hypericibacter adhaerens]HWA44909.1 ABC transporter permease [Hypericibacter adhaerens]